MADYKTLHGTNIETVSSDPSNPVNGQVWYNSTDQKVKGFTTNPAGSWAEGNNLNTARQRHAAAGTQTAALGFGGTPGPLNPLVEQWNGTAWTEVGDLNTGRYAMGGGGTTTATVGFGGFSTATVGATEEWDVGQNVKVIED